MRSYDIRFPIIGIFLTIVFSSLINYTYGEADVFSSLINYTYGEDNVTFQTYQNPDIGIRFQYPSDWGKIVEEGENCPKSCVLGLEDHGVGFSISKLQKEICECNSLMDHVKNAYNYQSGSLNGFSFIRDNQTTVGKNYSGWQYEYSSSPNGVNVTGLSVFFTNNDNYYSIGMVNTNETRAKLLPQLKKVIDSIEFLPPIQVPKAPSFMNASETEQSIPSSMLESNPNGLQILRHNSYTDSVGYFHVVGEVANNTTSTAEFVQVTGTFYDINNVVVSTQFTYTNPSDIEAGDKAPFEIILTSASALVDHYKLQASYD